MAQNSSIEWTDKTWNFLRGCSRVSEGCRNCYAERTAVRFAKPGEAYHGLVQSTPGGPRWTGKVEFFEHILLEPLKWRKPAKVFVNSMSDLFHEDVKDEWLDKAFAVMALTPQHTYQILTKRPERMREYLAKPESRMKAWLDAVSGQMIVAKPGLMNYAGSFGPMIDAHVVSFADIQKEYLAKWPLPNVWLGVSCEDQKTADERIPLLLQTPAAVRWVSAEPLLGPINFEHITTGHWAYGQVDVLSGYLQGKQPDAMYDYDNDPSGWTRNPPDKWEKGPHKIHWIVVGGESGPKARPFDIGWARSIIDQCKVADVPVFVKQLGASAYERTPYEGEQGSDAALKNLGEPDHPTRRWFREWTLIHTPDAGSFWQRHFISKDRKGGDMSEWPEGLRIRQIPEATGV